MKDVAYYLSKGFSLPMAEYFVSGRKRIVGVEPREDLTLLLTFDNGETRIYDCKPFLLPGTVFAQFAEYENFRHVYLDENSCVSWDKDRSIDSNIAWSNKVDLSPDVCYVESIPTKDL